MRLATSSRNGLTIVVDDLERRPQPRRVLKVPQGEVGSFQLLLPQLGQRVQAAAEQGSHLLRGHRVAGGQAVDPVHAGADPHPGRLAALGVVRRQTGMTFLGRIQRSDLPGQIVIPGPGGELVEAHRHTHPKGVHAAGAVRPTRATSAGAWGVWTCDLRSLRWLMRIGVPSGDVDTHWCGRARCRCMARGSRVSLDCCYEHAGLCPGRGPSGPAP